jgi:hypothetical protein
MKQAKLPIHPPIINRKCQFGACQEDLAFVIDGVDLCFEHGKIELNRRFIAELDKQVAPANKAQLELIK